MHYELFRLFTDCILFIHLFILRQDVKQDVLMSWAYTVIFSGFGHSHRAVKSCTLSEIGHCAVDSPSNVIVLRQMGNVFRLSSAEDIKVLLKSVHCFHTVVCILFFERGWPHKPWWLLINYFYLYLSLRKRWGTSMIQTCAACMSSLRNVCFYFHKDLSFDFPSE